MKKIMTLVLSMLLVFSLTLSPMAATLNDLLNSGRYGNPMYIRPDISSVVKTGSAAYAASSSVTVAGVSASPVTFDFKTTLGMYDVLGVKFDALLGADDELKAEINSADVHVKGEFTITVKFPSEIDVTSENLATGSMYGFTKNTGNADMAIYNDTAREVIDNGDGTKTLKITVKLVNPEDASLDYVTGAQLVANPAYLGDIEYTYSPSIDAYGTYPVTSTMRGETVFSKVDGGSETELFTVKYIPADPKSATATAEVKEPSLPGGSSSGRPSRPSTPSTPVDPDDPDDPTPGKKTEIPVVIRGQEPVKVPVKNGKVKVEDIKVPEREGFVVEGFYADAARTEPLTGEIDVEELENIYVKHINVVPPKKLNAEDHHAYIIGYPDGTIGPKDNIARDEVATIIYRLLDEDIRNEIESEENDFSDVPSDLWSNKYVSTMTKGGFIQGYENGKFKPEAPITRAELVTILSRIYADQLPEVSEDVECEYTDIKGHWAEKYIKAIYLLEIVNGYEDGTFKPDQYITRAEVMAIVNRALVRYAHEDGVIDGEYVEWSDCHVNDWYYHDVIEATNTHDYDRHDNGYHETHTEYGHNEWVSTGVYHK